MLFEMLIIFIIVSVILFLLIIECLFYQDSPTAKPKPGRHIGNWRPAVVFIAVNWIFIVLVAMGLYRIDWVYTSKYFSGNGTYMADIYSSQDYYFYSIIYLVFFFIHILLFVYAGYLAWQDALSTRNEMDYTLKKIKLRR